MGCLEVAVEVFACKPRENECGCSETGAEQLSCGLMVTNSVDKRGPDQGGRYDPLSSSHSVFCRSPLPSPCDFAVDYSAN